MIAVSLRKAYPTIRILPFVLFTLSTGPKTYGAQRVSLPLLAGIPVPPLKAILKIYEALAPSERMDFSYSGIPWSLKRYALPPLCAEPYVQFFRTQYSIHEAGTGSFFMEEALEENKAEEHTTLSLEAHNILFPHGPRALDFKLSCSLQGLFQIREQKPILFAAGSCTQWGEWSVIAGMSSFLFSRILRASTGGEIITNSQTLQYGSTRHLNQRALTLPPT